MSKWWNGRHANLRSQYQKVCGFESHLRYKKGSVVLNEQNFCLLSREMSVRIRLDPQKQSCSSIGGAPLLHSGGSRIVTDQDYKIGIQLSWLEHLADTEKVDGSSPSIPTNGPVAEWCRNTGGSGLQTHSRWFESSRDLKRFLSINGDVLVL